MTAGLERPTSGEVRIAGEVVNRIDPQDRNIAMVFQNYALYPHMTVYDNMSFGLRLHGMKKREIRARVEPAAEMLGLSDLLKRKPAQLSGGQRQRVAMGRAIVREPDAFLMDEPLSNLDAKLRVEMRAYLGFLHQRLRTTTLYVTHDQTEAITMGDRVAVMRGGRLEQCDDPQRLYDRPANLFVASFIGSPAMNLVRSRLRAEDGGSRSSSARRRSGCRPPCWSGVPTSPSTSAGSSPSASARRTSRMPRSLPSANGSWLDVDISLAEPMGAEVIAYFPVPAEQLAGANEHLELVAPLQAGASDPDRAADASLGRPLGRADPDRRRRRTPAFLRR